MAEVTIDTKKITDKASFHQVFKDALGFFDEYGRNMDAWIDCLQDLHDECGLCGITLATDEMLHLHITDTVDFNMRQPQLMSELVECSSGVNAYFLQENKKARLSLVFL